MVKEERISPALILLPLGLGLGLAAIVGIAAMAMAKKEEVPPEVPPLLPGQYTLTAPLIISSEGIPRGETIVGKVCQITVAAGNRTRLTGSVTATCTVDGVKLSKTTVLEPLESTTIIMEFVPDEPILYTVQVPLVWTDGSTRTETLYILAKLGIEYPKPAISNVVAKAVYRQQYYPECDVRLPRPLQWDSYRRYDLDLLEGGWVVAGSIANPIYTVGLYLPGWDVVMVAQGLPGGMHHLVGGDGIGGPASPICVSGDTWDWLARGTYDIRGVVSGPPNTISFDLGIVGQLVVI